MAGIQGLKKKLKSIEATGKLSKALKTVATVKFSRLHQAWKTYSGYAKEYRPFIDLVSGAEIENKGPESLSEARELTVCIGSARGFCGGFNANLAAFTKSQLEMTSRESAEGCRPLLISAGEHFTRKLKENGIDPDAELNLGEMPSFADTDRVIGACLETVAKFRDSSDDASGINAGPLKINVIYPVYKNSLLQIPEVLKLTYYPHGSEDSRLKARTRKNESVLSPDRESADEALWLPDRQTVTEELSRKAFRTLLYGCILETALGAQAATLAAMRSAYDASREYSESLEREIQRRRQSQVTADVIEISSERGQKGE